MKNRVAKVSESIRKRLAKVFKWMHYHQLSSKKLTIDDSKTITQSSAKTSIKVTNQKNGKVSVSLFSGGKIHRRLRLVHLQKTQTSPLLGQYMVLAGKSTGDFFCSSSRFIVLSKFNSVLDRLAKHLAKHNTTVALHLINPQRFVGAIIIIRTEWFTNVFRSPCSPRATLPERRVFSRAKVGKPQRLASFPPAPRRWKRWAKPRETKMGCTVRQYVVFDGWFQWRYNILHFKCFRIMDLGVVKYVVFFDTDGCLPWQAVAAVFCSLSWPVGQDFRFLEQIDHCLNY